MDKFIKEREKALDSIKNNLNPNNFSEDHSTVTDICLEIIYHLNSKKDNVPDSLRHSMDKELRNAKLHYEGGSYQVAIDELEEAIKMILIDIYNI